MIVTTTGTFSSYPRVSGFALQARVRVRFRARDRQYAKPRAVRFVRLLRRSSDYLANL